MGDHIPKYTNYHTDLNGQYNTGCYKPAVKDPKLQETKLDGRNLNI